MHFLHFFFLFFSLLCVCIMTFRCIDNLRQSIFDKKKQQQLLKQFNLKKRMESMVLDRSIRCFVVAHKLAVGKLGLVLLWWWLLLYLVGCIVAGEKKRRRIPFLNNISFMNGLNLKSQSRIAYFGILSATVFL